MKKISKPLRSIYPSRLHLGLWTLFPFLAFLLLQTAAAQTTFSDEIIITGHTYGAESVFSADLDGDGDYDVLSASSGDEKIAWYENTDGLGSFGQQQIIINNASEAYSVFSADLDGDGDNDVLSASSYENKIAWYENRDGLGNFSLQQIITTNANEARSVFSADLDGDGDYDVLSASFDDNKIAWYRNEGPPPPEVTIDLTYVAGSPVPAGGGNLVFDVFVENAAPIPVEFDGWLEIAYEGGASTNLLLQPFNNYQPGWTIDRPNMHFPVPSAYAAGNYTFTGKVGVHPNIVWDESSFPFEKLGTDHIDGFIPFPVEGVPNPFDVISVDGNPVTLPQEFSLEGPYPNPFNPATMIGFALPEASVVSLKVYDIQGREVVRLVDGYRDAGYYQITFDASELSSGIYIYRLTAGEFTGTGKMVLLK